MATCFNDGDTVCTRRPLRKYGNEDQVIPAGKIGVIGYLKANSAWVQFDDGTAAIIFLRDLDLICTSSAYDEVFMGRVLNGGTHDAA